MEIIEDFDTFSKGYDLGYDIAKEKFTNSNNKIKVIDSFYENRISLIEEFGRDYIATIEENLLFIEDYCVPMPRYLLTNEFRISEILLNHQTKDYQFVHLFKFLTKQYLNDDTIEGFIKSKTYCKMSLAFLDPDDSYYNYYLYELCEFKSILKEREWLMD